MNCAQECQIISIISRDYIMISKSNMYSNRQIDFREIIENPVLTGMGIGVLLLVCLDCWLSDHSRQFFLKSKLSRRWFRGEKICSTLPDFARLYPAKICLFSISNSTTISWEYSFNAMWLNLLVISQIREETEKVHSIALRLNELYYTFMWAVMFSPPDTNRKH
jgi:hypothetical protein